MSVLRKRIQYVQEPTPMWATSAPFVGLTEAELHEVKERITREVVRKFDYIGRHRA